MENLHLSRTTYQLIERAVDALKRIGRNLELVISYDWYGSYIGNGLLLFSRRTFSRKP